MATAEHAIDAHVLLEGPRGDNEEILLNAYMALANWSEALRVLRRPGNNREMGLRALALAQARSGNLAAAVETIMLMPNPLWRDALSEAALAATEDR